MKIEQDRFFEGLGFEKYEMEYEFGKQDCYKGPDGWFYRIDHFENNYVIESAENEDEARLNRFEDDDLYDDSKSDEEIIEAIRADLKLYIQQG